MAEKQKDGFEDWIGDSKEKSGFRKAADLGATMRTWPSGKEMEQLIKKGDISDTIRTPIQFLDPAYFDPILFFIQHRDRKELNFRLRYYYEYDECVGPLIDLHSTFPLSDFKVQCADSSIQRQYEDLRDRIELLTLLQDISKDFWMLGESFPYGRWNEAEKTWDFFSLIPPEKVELRSSYITPNPIIVLQVDDQLKKLVNSGDEVDQTIVRMMDSDVVEKMKSQNYIVLPPWQITHFAKKTSRTDLRGTSVLKRCLKPLLYKDKLRLLQFTIVDRFMSPIKIWKLGNPQTGWIPNKAHFEMLRQLLVSASNDPDFNIIFHHGLTTEFIDQKSKVENLIPHLEWCDKQITKALFSSEVLMTGGGVTYCHDEQTEILTENGFKDYNCVRDGEKLATVNPDTHALEYQDFTNRIISDYAGDLIHFKSQETDAMVTPNHRMLVRPRETDTWKMVEAKDVKPRSNFLGTVSGFSGKELQSVHVDSLEIDGDLFLKFLGYYLSEGCTIWRTENKNHCVYQVRLCQNVGSTCFKEMVETLEALPFVLHRYNKVSPSPAEEFVICSKSLAKFMLDNFPGKAGDKFIPSQYKNLSTRQLRILLQAMVQGDGNKRERKNGYMFFYTSKSKQLVDDVAEISFKLGYSPVTRIHYSLLNGKRFPIWLTRWADTHRGNFPYLNPEYIKKENYIGKVWCFTVPNGLLVTRRNGIVSIHGNSNANVSVRVLMHRYMVHRSQLELFVNNKIFVPVAKARGYWVPDKTGNNGPSTNINGKYKILDVPKMRWSKLNLIDDTSQKQFIMRLYEKGTIPHRLIADIFDLEENDLRHQLEQEQGTVVDPLYVKARQDAVGNPAVRDQVLKGKKTDEWILKAEKEEDKSKVKKAPRQTETPEVKPQPTPEEAGETKPPAGGAAPAGGTV